MSQPQPIFSPKKNDQTNIREVVGTYLRYWPWIILSGFICFAIAYVYAYSKNNVYQTTANVLVKDSKNGDIGSELDIFSDLGINKKPTNLHNEIEILNSRPLIKKVVSELKLNQQVLKEQEFMEPLIEYYGQTSPLFIRTELHDTVIQEKQLKARVEIISADKFKFTEINNDDEYNGTYSFNQVFNSSLGNIYLQKNNQKKVENGSHYIINIRSIKNAVSKFKGALNITPANQNSTVLAISMNGLVPEKNEDFINALIKTHEKQAIEDKNEITRHTSNFINERMNVIEKELSSVEIQGEDFKTSNELTDLELDAESYMQKEGSIEEQITSTVIERNLIEFMNDYLDSQEEESFLLPANLGFSDGGINSMTSEYNKLVMQRNKVVESSSADNPIAIKLENQIESLKNSLQSSLSNLKESIDIRMKELRVKEREYKRKLDNIPEYERRFREIARQQQIKETLYLYLLQKREENEIAMASTVGNLKVVENAFTSGSPVSPKRNIILIGAMLIGVLIPIGFIYVRDTLDNKVHSREDLEGMSIPVVAEIPQNKTKKYMVVQQGERSLVAEAFRMLRSNMNFLLPKKKEGGNVIFISSAIAGEGKTFNAINLANSLAMIDKKVVLVGMDLRAPKITRYLNIEDGKGVTNYLVDNKLSISDITVSSKDFDNLDYIISGDVPPNPSELLMRPRVDELFAQLRKEYDYIIVDNAPTTLVVDAMSIVQHSDLFLYVVRANYLEKKLLDDIKLMKEDDKIKNLAFILNDVDLKHSPYKGYGYGNRYGYGYGSGYVYGDEQKKPFWRRIFGR